MQTRTLIVDDEPLARRSLSSLLNLEPDFIVAGECADGRTAVEAIESLKPDLVFLDVQMPNMNGVEVIEALRPECRPSVIFVTAFDQYALKAFDARAVDYLLKPFRRERLAESLNRVRKGLINRIGRDMLPLRTPAADRMIVRSGDRLVFVPYDELDFLRSAANYVRLHLQDRTVDVRETLAQMQTQLPSDRFVRIHRSYIVNFSSVRELQHAGGGEYLVELRGGKHLPVGPTYPALIRDALARACVLRFGAIGGI